MLAVTGEAIDGAQARVCERPGGVIGGKRTPTATTAPDGFATLAHRLEEEAYLCVEHPNHLFRTVGPFDLRAGHTLDIGDVVLEASPVIAGIVVDEAGNPVRDAWVVGAPHKGGRLVRQAVRADGSFEILLVEPRPYSLQAVHPESVDHPDGTNQGPYAAGARDVRLVLESREFRDVLVRDAVTRAPVERFRLEEFALGRIEPVPGFSELRRAHALDYSYRMRDGEYDEYAQGRATTRVTTTERGFAVTAEGYQPWFGRTSLADSSSPLVVELERTRTLTGRAWRAAEPEAGVRVVLTTTEVDEPFAVPIPALSQRDGTFELAGVADGAHRLELFTEDGGFLTRDLLVDGDRDLGDLSLEAGAIVRGVVTVPEGRDPTELTMELRREGEAALSATRTTRVDAEGRFEYPPVEPGRYRLAALTPMFDSTDWAKPRVPVDRRRGG